MVKFWAKVKLSPAVYRFKPRKLHFKYFSLCLPWKRNQPRCICVLVFSLCFCFACFSFTKTVTKRKNKRTYSFLSVRAASLFDYRNVLSRLKMELTTMSNHFHQINGFISTIQFFQCYFFFLDELVFILKCKTALYDEWKTTYNE